MIFYSNFYGETSQEETTVDKTKPKENNNLKSDNNKQKQNPEKKEQLVKYILVWIVGGFISLMPTFVFLLINKWSSEEFADIVLMFFAEADLFLVITSLAISTLLEIVFSTKNNIAKNIVVALSILIIVISFHIFTLIKHGMTLPFSAIIGIILSIFCFAICIFGYSVICKSEENPKKEVK